MKVLIFIALKIVEVLGIVFAPFYLGKWVFPDDIWVLKWSCGVFSMAVLGFIAILGWFFIKLNWEWAEEIKNKLRS